MGWFELTEEDRPPEQIWLDDEALEAHFDKVFDRNTSGSDRIAVPEADMTQNELTADFFKR